ncbi:(2Fe-2S)-binding protein [Halobacteriales archaeon QS_8_69_26]|nr:MAG: (2Fe-2S)-binding protein [Halobacteriales archaeon QS_8_69_26]
MDDGARVAGVDEVPAESSFLFRVREVGSEETKEAILVRGDGPDDDAPEREESVAAWLNYCQHFTHIRLDKGSGVEVRGDDLVCTNHGAMFDAGSGLCTFGPCEGAYLESLDVTVRDAAVYLTDEDYEFDGVGPAERDPVDLASKSNVEF